MKSNKGFTLVEMLVTITILGIITVTALPMISNMQGTFNNSKYGAYKNSIETAAKLYTDSYAEDMFGYYTNGCYKITYSDLDSKNLVKKVDVAGVDCSNDAGTYVYAIKMGDIYEYESSLVCKDSKGNVVYSNSTIATSTCDVDIADASPKIVFDPDGSNPVQKIDVYIKLKNQFGYGLNQEVNYQWLDSAKHPITSATTIAYKNLPQSTELPLLSKKISSPPGLTGTYYLRVSPVNVSNYAEQDFTTDFVDSNKFLFDNISPTITASCDVNKSSNNLSINLNDNIRLAYYAITTSATAPADSDSAWKSTGNVTEKSVTLTKSAGNYYIHCRDAANNRSKKAVEVKIDSPTAPVIAGGGNSWGNSNRIIWVSTLSNSLAGIDRYQYCKNTSNNTSGCTWDNLYNNTNGVTSGLTDIAFYHSNHGDLINAFSGNVNQLNNHYINYGRNEGRATYNMSWLRSSQNFSDEGNYYVFFRGVTRAEVNTSPSNSAHLMIDKTNPTVSISTSKSSNSITVVANAIDNLSGIKTYYFKIDGNSYISKTSNSHTFTGLNYNSTHSVSVYVQDNSGNNSSVATVSVTTDSVTFGSYLRQTKTTGFNTSVLGNMYRYTGGTANNYVCIGTLDKNTCINNRDAYMYRVIGVVKNADGYMGTGVDMVKVIKESYTAFQAWGPHDSATYNMYWDSSWARNYVNSFPIYGGYDNLIADINWRHGTGARHDWNAQKFFNVESGWSWRSGSKKALMYVSDYLFATGNARQVCTDNSGASACTGTWIYLGGGDGNKQHFEYTMDYSSNSVIGSYSTIIIRNYSIAGDKAGALWPEGTNEARRVRPVFYLKTATYYASGSGSYGDPFMVK